MNPVPLPPGRGGLYSPLCVELLKLAVRQAQSRLPPTGGSTAAGGDRGAFPRAPGAVVWFPLQNAYHNV